MNDLDTKMKPYGVIIQASYRDIEDHSSAFFSLVNRLLAHETIVGVVVAIPKSDSNTELDKQLHDSGVNIYRGDDYNVAHRLIEAYEANPWLDDQFIVRLCSFWQLADLDLIDEMVETFRNSPCDYLALPKDFDITFAADIAAVESLNKVSGLVGDDQSRARARFNPWGWMEVHPDDFNLSYFTKVPTYQPDKIDMLSRLQLSYPENEFVGRDYLGSRYNFISRYINPTDRILDIACGSGQGTKVMSDFCSWVLGVDYLEQYIALARNTFPENKRLAFAQGDASDFIFKNGEFFDLVVSLHTIEHLPDDHSLIRTAYKNLRSGGRLILEAPLLAGRPLGRPTNPYHIREYGVAELEKMVTDNGFEIEARFWGCRDFYVEKQKLARDALQIHARKLNKGEFK